MKPSAPTYIRRILSGLGLAAAMLLLGTIPAKADSFRIGVGPHGGINFSYSSGGYCDRHGCPQDFWDMPVYYCPVYNRGRWYRGPVYYKHTPRGLRFWIRGAWRPDRWRGPRPPWACTDRLGPPLGFPYYEQHGFRMQPQWRKRWMRDHPDGYHRDRHPGPRDLRPGDARHDGRSMTRDRPNESRHTARQTDRRGDVRRDDRRGDAKAAQKNPKRDDTSAAKRKSDKDTKDDSRKDRHSERQRR